MSELVACVAAFGRLRRGATSNLPRFDRASEEAYGQELATHVPNLGTFAAHTSRGRLLRINKI